MAVAMGMHDELMVVNSSGCVMLLISKEKENICGGVMHFQI